MIVFLNGASSSGKTALARALQLQWSGPLLHLGTDTAIGMLPAAYVGMKPTAREGFEFYSDRDDRGPVVRVRTGPIGKKLDASFARVVEVLAQDGHDLVLDQVVLETADLKPYASALKGHRAYFVAVHCDLSVLEARELARGDRFLNLARPQHAAVHQDPRFYDLEVDTTSSGPHEVAEAIIAYVSAHPDPMSFQLLDSELNGD